MSGLRVCHVVPHLDRVGGLERSALALAEHQSRRQGLHATLLTHAAERAAERAAETPSETGVAIARLERGLRRHHPGGWWRHHRADISIVHAHGLHKLTGQVVALAHRDGIATLVKVATPSDVELFADPEGWRRLAESEPGAGADARAPSLRRRWMLRTAFRRLRHAGVFIALNDEIAAALALHGLPVERLPNGVDCRRFHPPTAAERAAARADLGLQPHDVVALFAGRLAARKDVGCLLAAAARLASQADAHAHANADTRHAARPSVPRIVVVVAGDGEQGTALRARAAAAGLDERVLFTGLRHDVRPLLAAADVFVNPALSEGQPNAVLEAFACGLPAVLSDISGHRDGASAPTDAAVLFPPRDSDALAAALARLAADPAHRAALAVAARRRALERHDLDSVAERYLQLYRRLLADRPAARPPSHVSGARRGEGHASAGDSAA